MLSVNHSLADGGTFYELWRMLDTTQPVSEIKFDRIPGIQDLVAEHTDLIEMAQGNRAYFAASSVFHYLGRGMMRTMTCKSQQAAYLYKVDMGEVNKIKTRFNSEQEGFYVSTNDVLCSWFFRICVQNDRPFFTINLKNRLPGVDGTMAGNYMYNAPLHASDVKSPKTFRQAWQKWLYKEIGEEHGKMKPSVVWNFTTDWSQSYHQVELQRCVHRLHLPVVEVQPKFMGIPFGPMSSISPFLMNNGELAVYIYAYNDIMSEEHFDQCPLLERKLQMM